MNWVGKITVTRQIHDGIKIDNDCNKFQTTAVDRFEQIMCEEIKKENISERHTVYVYGCKESHYGQRS